ncbi:GAF domain-containing protein [Phyllobacterium sp. 628]|uniref:GAF domain-containing protein n=1 Tax=Phyllobacterium sp. 628 TaxID=2718938 RepID=UPI0016623DF7|nr:GAF domain-containing protein [Phyllobacterium sp. 628]QND51727.1 GAF domain-containing protein [Phyllobacterium sp. 628]
MSDLPLSVLNDAHRLAALDKYDILDTPAEPAFDNIVSLAKQICETPVALISLVTDNRQWFKARSGFEPCETPLEQSVCAHALPTGSVLIIPDLTLDERTKNNTLVTEEPFIRFYAGAVLNTPSGEAIGTLCVIDNKPRPGGLTEAQTEALQDLAEQVITILELRRVLEDRNDVVIQQRRTVRSSLKRALTSEAARNKQYRIDGWLGSAQQAGGIGAFELDMQTNMSRVTPEMCRLYGLEESEQYPAPTFEVQTYEEDRHLVSDQSSRSEGNVILDIEYRIKRADDGALRWLSRRGELSYDDNGRPAFFRGTVQDITKRKTAEIRQAALLELGDNIRDASTTGEAAEIASRILCDNLGAGRAGFAIIDLTSDLFNVERDWVTAGLKSMAGRHSLVNFTATIKNSQIGIPIAVADIPNTEWLALDYDGYSAIEARSFINVPLMHNGELVGLMFVHDKNPRDWQTDDIQFVVSIADRTYAAIAKLQAEHEQGILNQELSHRLKNTLTMVQAIATQTLRDAPQDAVEAFKQRIMALSSAHNVLLHQNWSAARIRSVLESVLALHGEASQFTLFGPNLNLGPKAVLSLSLLLHELATNALKYGSLSDAHGNVGISWEIQRAPSQLEFVLTWRERGGPIPVEPSKKGFGSRLIRFGLSGTGDADLQYEKEGLVARFKAPLALVMDN